MQRLVLLLWHVHPALEPCDELGKVGLLFVAYERWGLEEPGLGGGEGLGEGLEAAGVFRLLARVEVVHRVDRREQRREKLSLGLEAGLGRLCEEVVDDLLEVLVGQVLVGPLGVELVQQPLPELHREPPTAAKSGDRREEHGEGRKHSRSSRRGGT